MKERTNKRRISAAEELMIIPERTSRDHATLVVNLVDTVSLTAH